MSDSTRKWLLFNRLLTGQDMPAVQFRWPQKPRGRQWDFDDDEQVARRLPELAKVYLGEPPG
jgi:hypothetical protein